MKKTLKVNFDLCTFCNHKCTFCSNSDARTIKNMVTLDDFIKVMDNITSYIEIDKLSLSAKGEVLLNKDLVDIIKYSKDKYNINYVYFSTNGADLTFEKMTNILNSGINSIKFSINGFNKESYRNIHKKDDFDKVIENLKLLLKLKKEEDNDFKVYISSVTDISENEIMDIFKDLLGDLYRYIDEIARYELQFTPKIDNKEDIKINPEDCLISPFKEIYINSDCSLGFCCKDYFDEINFGSLLENNFMELYNGNKYKSMRQKFLDNSFDKDSLCYKCLAFEGLKK